MSLQLNSVLKVLDASLQGQDWLVGNCITITDITCVGYLFCKKPSASTTRLILMFMPGLNKRILGHDVILAIFQLVCKILFLFLSNFFNGQCKLMKQTNLLWTTSKQKCKVSSGIHK